MGRNKKYSGYKAFQFLEPGVDYKEFKLREEMPADMTEWVTLTKIEEERFETIMEKSVVISLHDHPSRRPEKISEREEYSREGREFLAYESLAKSGLDCVLDNMMNGSNFVNTKHGWDWMSTVHDLGMKLCDIAKQDFVVHAKSVADILYAHETGRLAWVGSVESCSCIENEVDRLDVLYGLGVRCMGVNYSESNMLGSGLKELHDGGLTDFGYDCVVRMNKLGILIDTAHVSPQTVLDTISLSKKPVTISHSGSRTLTPTTRMIPDDVIKALAERRGVIGVEAAPNLTVTAKHPLHGIDSYMEHVEHIISLVGIDHVGCGPDTGYYDHVGNYLWSLETGARKGLGHYQRPNRRTSKPQHLGIDMDVEALSRLRFVRGMENPTDSIQNVARWMVKHGYSDLEIGKVIGGNALRLLGEAW